MHIFFVLLLRVIILPLAVVWGACFGSKPDASSTRESKNQLDPDQPDMPFIEPDCAAIGALADDGANSLAS